MKQQDGMSIREFFMVFSLGFFAALLLETILLNTVGGR